MDIWSTLNLCVLWLTFPKKHSWLIALVQILGLRQLSHLMTKPRGGEAISKDLWQKWDRYHTKMPACCMCALQFPTLQCGSYYNGCDAPAAGKGRREEILGGGTGTNKRQEAQGVQGKSKR